MDNAQVCKVICSWDNLLTRKQKKYIHYRSMRNFCYHLSRLPKNKVKQAVISLLTEYAKEVADNDFNFDADSGYDLAIKYLSKLSDYYHDNLDFKSKIKLSDVLIWGFLADSLFFLIGLLGKVGYIPVITLTLLLYYLLLLIFKESKGKVYGLFY
jgi:hypothetical protein